MQPSAGCAPVQRAIRNPVEVLQGAGAAPRQPHPQQLLRRRQEAEEEAELADFLDDGPGGGGGGGGDGDWRAELRSITGYDPSRWACINSLALKHTGTQLLSLQLRSIAGYDPSRSDSTAVFYPRQQNMVIFFTLAATTGGPNCHQPPAANVQVRCHCCVVSLNDTGPYTCYRP